MSSYLSFYIVPKRKSEKEPKQHLILAAFSRSNEIYQYFNENVNPAWSGDGETYTHLDKEEVGLVMGDISKDIESYKARLVEYERFANNNPEYIEEIVQMKKDISDLEYWRGMAAFIDEMVDSANYYDTIEEVCCNIT